MTTKLDEYRALLDRIFKPDDSAPELTDEQFDQIHERLDDLWSELTDAERTTVEEWRKSRGDA